MDSLIKRLVRGPRKRGRNPSAYDVQWTSDLYEGRCSAALESLPCEALRTGNRLTREPYDHTEILPEYPKRAINTESLRVRKRYRVRVWWCTVRLQMLSWNGKNRVQCVAQKHEDLQAQAVEWKISYWGGRTTILGTLEGSLVGYGVCIIETFGRDSWVTNDRNWAGERKKIIQCVSVLSEGKTAKSGINVVLYKVAHVGHRTHVGVCERSESLHSELEKQCTWHQAHLIRRGKEYLKNECDMGCEQWCGRRYGGNFFFSGAGGSSLGGRCILCGVHERSEHICGER